MIVIDGPDMESCVNDDDEVSLIPWQELELTGLARVEGETPVLSGFKILEFQSLVGEALET